ncbi:NAD(P)/FAD-dependent oxidoreductase [Alkanindiges sp. WGS2144]|uniref:NAD(P)/FAD-dependent oxidoreductase n=1 Tax=Alkanindiges sp. WGS2144 TaxID=3366808 RepID=UPI0037513F2E
MNPLVIVGSGMAGYTLAREFRKLDSTTPVVMISADDAVNYAKPTLSNALAGNKHPDQIGLGDAAKMSSQLNMNILTHTTVSHIDCAGHLLTLQQENGDQTTQPYSKLVLAVGANPIRLPIEGNAAGNIHVVNSLADYRAFRENLSVCNNKRVLLLGAGLIGCEFANDLTATGHEVTVVDIASQPLGRLLPSDTAKAFQVGLEAIGVKFALNTTVERLDCIDGEYQVRLTNGETLSADIVLSAIGLHPNLELAQAASIQTSRGITVDALLQSSQPDIYAIGDCAEVTGHLLPFVMPIMQQARALAKTLAGTDTPVHYPAMPVAVKTPAAPLTVLPAPVDVFVEWQTETFEDGMLAKAMDSEGTLRGFVLLGATAGKQRMALTKLVPDLLPPASA